MPGHIRLGLTADTLQDYMLNDVRRRRRQLANSMAPRLATGGEFNDYENWSLHAVTDWREGIGKRSEDAAGFLFGEVESRVPEQLLLPMALGCAPISFYDTTGEVTSYMPAEADAYSTQSVGGTGNPTRISIEVGLYAFGEANLTPHIEGIAFFGYVPDGVEVTAALYSNSSGSPGSSVASGTLTASTNKPGHQWYYVPLSSSYAPGIDGLVTYHWVIYPTSSTNEIEVAQGDTYSGDSYTYNGSAWSANTGACPFFVYDQPYLQTSSAYTYRRSGVLGFMIDASTDDVCVWSGLQSKSTGALSGSPLIYRYNSTTDIFEYDVFTSGAAYNGWGSLTPDDIGQSVMFDGVSYLPQGDNYSTWTVSGDVGGSSTNDAHLFASWAGYIWRAYNNQLWYSADGSTWTEVTGGIGSSDFAIRGLAGLGANMYVSTDEALYSIFPGDVVVGIFPWGTVSPDNGRGMIAHQGALYIPAQGRLWKYTEDGTLTDIWVSRDDDLNAARLGRIVCLASLNNSLIAGVNGTTENDPASILAYTGIGWHHTATLPPRYSIRSAYYDRIRSRLWIASNGWAVFYLYAPDWALNPYNDSSSVYMPAGWMETDRLYLGSRDLFKDCESVRVYGEFSTGTAVDVYWRDQDSTGWELLGTVDADGDELRWDTVATRPATRWIKIGLLPTTTDPAATPQIRAWALKAMPMIRDRWRWDLVIAVADNQQMIGGQMDDRYADDKRDAIEGLVESIAPVLFEDVDGRQYWVKVMSAGESLDNYENDGYGTVQWSMMFNLSLEQIQSVFT